MFGINKRIKILHGDDAGDPLRRKTQAPGDRSALAVLLAMVALFLVAVMSFVLARNVDSLTRLVSTRLDRLSEVQVSIRKLNNDMAQVRQELGGLSGETGSLRYRMSQEAWPGGQVLGPELEIRAATDILAAARDRLPADQRREKLDQALRLLREVHPEARPEGQATP